MPSFKPILPGLKLFQALPVLPSSILLSHLATSLQIRNTVCCDVMKKSEEACKNSFVVINFSDSWVVSRRIHDVMQQCWRGCYVSPNTMRKQWRKRNWGKEMGRKSRQNVPLPQ